MKCTYRATADCRMPKRPWTPGNCQLCLMGQQADEIGLLTSAVMNMSIERTLDKTELMNSLYWAILPECERIEHNGNYKGNGHHLAQRLTAMVADELLKKDKKEKAQAQEASEV